MYIRRFAKGRFSSFRHTAFKRYQSNGLQKEFDEKNLISLDNREFFTNFKEFESFSISDHGSLIQEDSTNSEQNPYNDTYGLERLHGQLKIEENNPFEEEELNLNNSHSERFDSKRISKKKIKELKGVELFNFLNRNFDKENKGKIDYDFLKEFEYKRQLCLNPPPFPKLVTVDTLNSYLKDVNTYKFDRLQYYRVLDNVNEILNNTSKLDTVLNYQSFREILKFFLYHQKFRKIINVIESFERIGILPNNEILQLILFYLNKNNELHNGFKFYLFLSINQWKVKIDRRTKLMYALTLKAGIQRQTILKNLINEGINLRDIKWYIIEDCIDVGLSKQSALSIDEIIKYLKLKNYIENNPEDLIQVHDIYTKNLAKNGRGDYLMKLFTENKIRMSSKIWIIFIEELIHKKELTNCIGVFNTDHLTENDRSTIGKTILKNNGLIFQIIKEKQLGSDPEKVYYSLIKYIKYKCSFTVEEMKKLLVKLPKKLLKQLELQEKMESKQQFSLDIADKFRFRNIRFPE